MRRLSRSSAFLALLLSVAASAAAPEAPEAAPAPPPPPASPWLGVLLGNAVDGGAQVVALVPQGPAANAGILEGDVILSVAGHATPDREALGRAVALLEPGQTATVTILRGGQSVTRTVSVARRAAPVPLPLLQKRRAQEAEVYSVAGSSGGMSVAPIPRELRLHYGAPADAGVLVTSVDPGGSAAAAKVRVGDVLVSVDGTPLSEDHDLPRALIGRRDPESVSLALVRDRKPVTAKMALAIPMQREREMELSAAPEAMALYGADPDAEKILALEREIERLTERLAAVEQELQRVKKEP
jgi:S1-C subfamily serine protease